MPYVQAICLFVKIFLDEADVLPSEMIVENNPLTYLDSIMTISFLCAMWGCFLLMDMAAKFKIIEGHKFILKAALIKTLVGFVNLQSLIIDILVGYDIIECKEYLSNIAFGGLISNICSLCEAFLLGNACFFINMCDQNHH